MHKLPLSSDQIRTILEGLPDPPNALGRNEVMVLIQSVMLKSYPSEQMIFEWIFQQDWMAPAIDLPRDKNGEFHFYRRTKTGREALIGGLMTRKSQWV
jgi:hypothetical protein